MTIPLRYLPQALEHAVQSILMAAGAGDKEAATVARYLVLSDMSGHPSHGVMRVRQYVDQIRIGQIACGIDSRVVNEGPGFAVLDAQLGFGQVGAAKATRLACEKAAAQGIAMVALRNSAHVGRLGDWVELAAEFGCASFHFVNTLAMSRVAPWGGREPRLSTNPLAWGMPVAGREPIVVDLTTSVVAEGKVRLARNAGKSIPAGWIVDRHGRSTTDPVALYEGGSLLPLGGLDAGHKGFALSLMVDLMAGAMSGGGASGADRIINSNNFTVIAIALEQVAPAGSIAQEAARFADWICSAPPVDASRPVMLPGDIERALRGTHLRDGLPLEAGIIQILSETAVLAGVPAASMDQLISDAAIQPRPS